MSCQDGKSFHVIGFNGRVIAYEKRESDWEPPPVIIGWRRKNRDMRSPEAWVHIPIFEECKFRTIRRLPDQRCGKIDLKIKCSKLGFEENHAARCCKCSKSSV